ncbi:uncharacterized protein MONOS_17695 [Monocercomonoides exilis]|uniref:uncharacterized protein n=1 Tax=Monocercomonoides exilis TaxID=2049356 RepID=UPI00355A89E5|nr:hypothetical protein MONOS_17695 [Monocercomonoides exilis]
MEITKEEMRKEKKRIGTICAADDDLFLTIDASGIWSRDSSICLSVRFRHSAVSITKEAEIRAPYQASLFHRCAEAMLGCVMRQNVNIWDMWRMAFELAT